jgi:hypothetical protein
LKPVWGGHKRYAPHRFQFGTFSAVAIFVIVLPSARWWFFMTSTTRTHDLALDDATLKLQAKTKSSQKPFTYIRDY